MFNQLFNNFRQMFDSHQEDNRSDSGNGLPIDIGVGAPSMPSHDCKGSRHTSLRHGNPCIRRYRNGTAHARDYFITDTSFCQHLAFLPAAPKHEGIAPFQTYNNLAITRFLDQQSIDLILRATMSFGLLANIDQFSMRWHLCQKLLGDKPVMEYHIGTVQTVQAFDSDQARVPRPSADDIDNSWFG